MRVRRIVPHCAASLAVAAIVIAPEARAQAHDQHDAMAPSTGYRAELLQDIDQLEEKFLGLAGAMTGKYTWSPSAGVRSVSQVYMHMASANFMLPTMAGVMAPEGIKAGSMEEMMETMRELEAMTDEAKVKEMVQRSFGHVRHAIATISDDDLDTPVEMFGQEATKRAVLHLVVTHIHEHLGQSIAYARMNQVVPPWSGGGN